jgi:hypothetical protein
LEAQEFYGELSMMVARRGDALGLVDTLAFISELAERLEEDPAFGEGFQLVDGYGEIDGRGAKKIHGFTSIDPTDASMSFVIGKWSNLATPPTLTTAETGQLFRAVDNFCADSISGRIKDDIVQSNAAYEAFSVLHDENLRPGKIRIHLFTNSQLSGRYNKEVVSKLPSGILVEHFIWDLNRIQRLYESVKEREAVEIKLSDFSGVAIPCLKATESGILRSYLCTIPGSLLADLFERYGSRLLEGNVRSFLGTKNSVNQDIKRTIQRSPEYFFAYNNGIAATASNVKILSEQAGTFISEITDLQIVNGGQTTATILSAKKSGIELATINVAMKLTEISDRDAAVVIPKIAEYANTQTKIQKADFFSNHPFHQKMEEISRRLTTPATANRRVSPKWFYERSRGQYQNERLYLSRAKLATFDLEYPTDHVVNKTDLAKYDSVRSLKPYWAALGAQSNFSKFADKFTAKKPGQSDAELWDELSPSYGDSYYQDMISIAIIWKKLERLISQAQHGWYLGDYRAQIVVYTISTLFRLCSLASRPLNLSKVWSTQATDSELDGLLVKIATIVQGSILAPPAGITNVGQWCKREGCWLAIESNKSLSRIQIPNSWTVSSEEAKSKRKDDLKMGLMDDGVSLQITVMNLAQAGYWRQLCDWTEIISIAPADQIALLRKAATVQGVNRIALPSQWKTLMRIKEAAEKSGFEAK